MMDVITAGKYRLKTIVAVICGKKAFTKNTDASVMSSFFWLISFCWAFAPKISAQAMTVINPIAIIIDLPVGAGMVNGKLDG